MLCNNCGKEISDDIDFCPNCGSKLNSEDNSNLSESNIQEDIQDSENNIESNSIESNSIENINKNINSDIQNIKSEIPEQQQKTQENINSNTPENNEEDNEEPKNTTSLKAKIFSFLPIFLCLLICSTFVIVKVIEICFTTSSNYYMENANPIMGYYNNNDNITFYNLNGKKLETKATSETYQADIDAYSTYTCYIDNGNLYYMNAKLSPKKIDTDVDFAKLSHNGEGIAYIKASEENSTIGDLYVYTCYYKKLVKIGSNVPFNSVNLSPNGSYVSYTETNDDLTDYKVYVSSAKGLKREVKPDTDIQILPAGTTNTGEVYCYKISEEGFNVDGFFINTKKGNIKLYEGNVDTTSMLLNEDNTQISFSADDGMYLYKLKAKNPIKISDCKVNDWITPNHTVISAQNDYAIPTSGIASFKEVKFIDKSNTLYMVKNNLKEVVPLLKQFNYENSQLAKDSKSIIYMKDDELYRLRLNGKNNEKCIFSNSDQKVTDFVANEDLSEVYIVTNSNTLGYFNGFNNRTITDNLDNEDLIFAPSLGGVVYSQDGGLNISKKRKVTKLADNIEMFMPCSYSVVYRVEDGDNFRYYYIRSRKKQIELPIKIR